MTDLTNTTFIIPVRIEHQDRYNNAECTLTYLNHHFKTNVFIYEVSDDGSTKLDFLPRLKNLNVSIINDTYSGTFHRMHYLNVLLNEVTTPVVCNYDIDVTLVPKIYQHAADLILKNEADVVYPYGWGYYQAKVNKSFDRTLFLENCDLLEIDSVHLTNGSSECGHCVFFNTEVYRKEGGENENFISWGPEDKERAYRFRKLGYKVFWLDNVYVYHFEHERGSDSGKTNPYLEHNEYLFNSLLRMNDTELRDYYKAQTYIQQYDNFLHSQQK